MTDINYDMIAFSCDRLQHMTTWKDGHKLSSVRAFDACMRAFDNKALPARAITFSVCFYDTNIKGDGFFRIYRNGKYIAWIGDDHDREFPEDNKA